MYKALHCFMPSLSHSHLSRFSLSLSLSLSPPSLSLSLSLTHTHTHTLILTHISLTPSLPPSLPPQDLYGVRSDLGNLYKALGRLEDAKVMKT